MFRSRGFIFRKTALYLVSLSNHTFILFIIYLLIYLFIHLFIFIYLFICTATLLLYHIQNTFKNFHVLLNVHLSIIFAINQLNA